MKKMNKFVRDTEGGFRRGFVLVERVPDRRRSYDVL